MYNDAEEKYKVLNEAVTKARAANGSKASNKILKNLENKIDDAETLLKTVKTARAAAQESQNSVSESDKSTLEIANKKYNDAEEKYKVLNEAVTKARATNGSKSSKSKGQDLQQLKNRLKNAEDLLKLAETARVEALQNALKITKPIWPKTSPQARAV